MCAGKVNIILYAPYNYASKNNVISVQLICSFNRYPATKLIEMKLYPGQCKSIKGFMIFMRSVC